MRIAKFLLTPLMIFLFVSSALASGDMKVKKDLLDNNVFVLECNYTKATNFTLSIEDNYGRKLVEQVYPNAKSIMKKFRLVDCEDGKYRITVRSEGDLMIKKFDLDRGSIIFDDQVSKYFTPTIKLDEDQLGINFLSFANSNFTMSLRDAAGDELYSENTRARGNYKRVFSIEKLPEGVYYATLRNEDMDYEHKFIIVE